MNGASSPYFQKQLKIAFEIIDSFKFNEPFHIFLKKKFQQNKNWGSKDRKNYRNICYIILRNYPLFKDLDTDNRIQQFSKLSDGILQFNAFEELAIFIDPSIKIEVINQSFNRIAPVFFVPFSQNKSLETPDFSQLLGYVGQIAETNSLIFDGSSNLDEYVSNKFGYIQDYSSSSAIKKISSFCDDALVWDACCASGGKSLSVLKYSKPQKHYCSDIRPEIINNLVKRFELSPYMLPECFVFDALKSSKDSIKFTGKRNIIIADLPCSGSGNWRRNPENRWTFNEGLLSKYQELQRSIFTSLYKQLPVGDYIYYMTCSIFKAENQENIEYLKNENEGLKIEFQEYFGGIIEGYDSLYSDYIFGCLIQKAQ